MSTPQYFKFSEDIVDILVAKTQSQNRHFFRLLVAYYLSKVSSMMRCNIETRDRGVIPVNTYVLNLMPSGAGKGFLTNIMEEDIIDGLILSEFFLKKWFFSPNNLNFPESRNRLKDMFGN